MKMKELIVVGMRDEIYRGEDVTPKEQTQEDLDWLNDFLSTWSKLTASVQDIQLDVAEQDYLNGELD
jgi:hypothetical protein